VRGSDQSLGRFRVLLTRQSGLNDNLVAKLDALGVRTAEVPALSVSEAGPPEPLVNKQLNEEEYSDVIFVSRNAVEHGLSRAMTMPGFGKARILAVGNATAGALTDMGIPARKPRDGSGSEALMALPELSGWSGRTVLIVRGMVGREWLAEELLRRGAVVDYLEAYRASTPVGGAERLARSIREFKPNMLFIHSSAGLKSILQMSGKAKALLMNVPMVAGAESIRDIALAAGWSARVQVAVSPGDSDMLSAFSSFE
jgi:uroporphyrinogen-III synthase